MSKVVSFKKSDEIYSWMKASGKTFKEILEPLIEEYFTEKHRIHQCIPKEPQITTSSLQRNIIGKSQKIGFLMPSNVITIVIKEESVKKSREWLFQAS